MGHGAEMPRRAGGSLCPRCRGRRWWWPRGMAKALLLVARGRVHSGMTQCRCQIMQFMLESSRSLNIYQLITNSLSHLSQNIYHNLIQYKRAGDQNLL